MEPPLYTEQCLNGTNFGLAELINHLMQME